MGLSHVWECAQAGNEHCRKQIEDALPRLIPAVAWLLAEMDENRFEEWGTEVLLIEFLARAGGSF